MTKTRISKIDDQPKANPKVLLHFKRSFKDISRYGIDLLI